MFMRVGSLHFSSEDHESRAIHFLKKLRLRLKEEVVESSDEEA